MSEEQLCALCCTTCSEYKSLQNSLEEWNETYYITVKYFDPKLLQKNESTTSQHNAVLCQNCWSNINEFHEFQQNVLKTRMWENESQSKTLRAGVNQEQENTFVSNVMDNNSFTKSKDDNLLGCNLEYGDFKTKSLTRFQDALESLHKETLGGNIFQLYEDNNKKIEENVLSEPDNNNLDKGDKDNSLECNSEYGDIKTGSLLNSRASIESIDNQSDETDEENTSGKNVNDGESNLANKVVTERTENIKTSEFTKATEPKDSYRKKASPKELDEVIANWRSELTCDLCNETSTNFYKLSKHFKVKHKTNGYVKCCERKFYRRFLLASHIEIHLDPEVCKCDICGKSFKTKGTLKYHKTHMHEETLLQCEFCTKLFTHKRTLERHLLTHSTNKDFICSDCGKGYVNAKALKTHIKYVHNFDRVCNECGKNIHGIYAFYKHLMEHSGIKPRTFPCDICGVELKTATNLKRHKSIYHNDGSSIYVCGVCGKIAPSENALLNHKKLVHQTNRRHKCKYCNKDFKRLLHLREHTARHTGEDLYQCSYCPQKFKTSRHMYAHRRKDHPVEWEEARKNLPKYPKINNSRDKKQIVIY